MVLGFFEGDFADINTNDFSPTCDIRWVQRYENEYYLEQRWKCRFAEKSLKDIWLPISIKEE